MKTQGGIVGGFEGKQRIVPVMNAKNLLGIESCHVYIKKVIARSVKESEAAKTTCFARDPERLILADSGKPLLKPCLPERILRRAARFQGTGRALDRKSTRLNSSH